MTPIFLTGFMCSGKSTLGQALADTLGRPFVDLDTYIEAAAGASVADIFAAGGETAFRRRETAALAEVCARHDAPVVAVGGGTPCHGDNAAMMLGAGTVIHLTCRRDRLMARIREGRDRRPLLAALDDTALDAYVDRTMAERAAAYARAHHTFDATYLEDADEIAATVRRFISLYIH